MPSERGTYLTMFWLQNGKLEEQQRWVSEQTAIQQQQGRVFTDRDVMTATTYDYLGGAFRDDDGVPPEYALDHRYAGVVWTFLEREPSASLEQARDWVLGELPPLLADAPVAMTLSFTPLPKAPWWPKAAPEVPGVGDRVVSAALPRGGPARLLGALRRARQARRGRGPRRAPSSSRPSSPPTPAPTTTPTNSGNPQSPPTTTSPGSEQNVRYPDENDETRGFSGGRGGRGYIAGGTPPISVSQCSWALAMR